ncbi:MAG: hypothetical protein Q8882_05385 [Bacillota bacterium]|nr:hypothetical protein [Bacillota bacterium]
MDVMNERVSHRQFGDGMITGQTETTVVVKFSGQEDAKKFSYPSAFESYLKLCNPALQEKVNGELKKIKMHAEDERKLQEEEEERRIQEKRAAVKKVSVAKKKTAKKVKKVSEPEDEDSDI